MSPLDRWRWAAHVPVDRVVDRALLLVLAENADRRTLEVNRAMRTLQTQLRIGQRRLVEARQRLIARGLITIGTTVRNKATTYRLHIDMAAVPQDDRVASNGGASVASNGAATAPAGLHPFQHSLAPPLDVDPGIIQGGGDLPAVRGTPLPNDHERESLNVNEETVRLEPDGVWAAGPYRFPRLTRMPSPGGRRRRSGDLY